MKKQIALLFVLCLFCCLFLASGCTINVPSSDSGSSGGGDSSNGGTTDTSPPTINNRNPAKDSSDKAVSCNISFEVDDATGVNITTLNVTIEGENAIVGGAIKTQNDYTGSINADGSNGYDVTINPGTDFDYGQVVDIVISASDSASSPNAMTPVSYSFSCVSSVVEIAVQRHYPDDYLLRIEVNESNISSIDVSGPNIDHYWQSEPDEVLVRLLGRPTIGDTYTLTVNYVGGSSDQKECSVEGINDNFAMITYPQDGGFVDSTIPTFTWNEASNIEEYLLIINDSSGNHVWLKYFAPGTSSYEFNYDGQATEDLQIGQSYTMTLHAFDSNHNQATTQATFNCTESGTWTMTGSLNEGRCKNTTTLLTDGRVLVVGGHSSVYLSSYEIYDTSSETWDNAGNIGSARILHTATLLSNGKVLVAGGRTTGSFNFLTSCLLFDPADDSWSDVASMNQKRSDHRAVLLANNRVLVIGGEGWLYLTSCEIYDPDSNTWTVTGSLNRGRSGHTATLLNDDRVLVTGGRDNSFISSCEIFNPDTSTWEYTASLNEIRTGHTATLLENGQVLVVGGYYWTSAQFTIDSCQLYDPDTDLWSDTASLVQDRYRHTDRKAHV